MNSGAGHRRGSVSWLLVWIIACSLPISLSCEDDSIPTAPSDISQLNISLIHRDVSEIALNIISTDTGQIKVVQLTRYDSTVSEVIFLGYDTTITDDSLTQNTEYLYKAYRLKNGLRVNSSNSLNVSTMGTTSHEFVWKVDTLGDGENSILKDVSIVNDTCVFAVGEIRIHDSAGGWDPTNYHVARWNGSTWTYSVGASVTMNAIHAFTPSDVWAGTSGPYHYDGTSWRPFPISGGFNGYVNKIWGSSSNNVYMVGTHGQIMHFNGETWQHQESGTNVDLLDVWGSLDGSVVWACGYSDFKSRILLRSIDGGPWEKAWEKQNPFTPLEDSLSGTITSVWTSSNFRVYALTGYGVYRCPASTNGEGSRTSFTAEALPAFPNRLRGVGANDLTIVGYNNLIAHYNGVNWRYYSEFYREDEHLFSVDQKNNLVIAVGEIYDPIHSRGIVLWGRR